MSSVGVGSDTWSDTWSDGDVIEAQEAAGRALSTVCWFEPSKILDSGLLFQGIVSRSE